MFEKRHPQFEKTVSFTRVQLGNDWSGPQANYHVKRRDQYISGSSTLLAVCQGGRVLKIPRRPLTDMPEDVKRVVDVGVGNIDDLI